MNLNINIDDICMSNRELLEMVERSLHLDYSHSYVQNGVVYHRTFNNYDGFTEHKTKLPEEVYSAYVTIRKYLLNKEDNHAE